MTLRNNLSFPASARASVARRPDGRARIDRSRFGPSSRRQPEAPARRQAQERPVGLPAGALLDPCLSRSISCGESVRPSDLGGIRSVSSLEVIRLTSSLSSRLPGTTALEPDSVVPKAPSLVSSLSPALRFRGSGPWHLKHLSERIGRISKLKSTGFWPGSPARGASSKRPERPQQPRDAPAHRSGRLTSHPSSDQGSTIPTLSWRLHLSACRQTEAARRADRHRSR